MAKKSTSGRKSGEEAGIAAGEGSTDLSAATQAETSAAQADETPPSKSKARATEDQPSTGGGSVGISDIRKAVAFANSVGGLDKAIALLQIVKVAKEVQ